MSRDCGDHFKVVGLKNLANVNKHCSRSVFLPSILHFVHHLEPGETVRDFTPELLT